MKNLTKANFSGSRFIEYLHVGGGVRVLFLCECVCKRESQCVEITLETRERGHGETLISRAGEREVKRERGRKAYSWSWHEKSYTK